MRNETILGSKSLYKLFKVDQNDTTSTLYNKPKKYLEAQLPIFHLCGLNHVWHTGFLLGKTNWDPLHQSEIWLIPPHYFVYLPPTIFCPKNADFFIFMQFLDILVKMPPLTSADPNWKTLM